MGFKATGAMVAGTAFAAVIGLGPIGGSVAGAATSSATARGADSAQAAKAPVGTYEWFLNGDQGQITLNLDHTWTAVNHGDGGTWLVSGKTIALSFTEGADVDTVEMGTVQKHGFSTAKKPGTWVNPNSGQSGTWYAVKL